MVKTSVLIDAAFYRFDATHDLPALLREG